MGKFRSRIKGGTKGKRWRKGGSSSSNPSVTKFRDAAKSRFFHENLGSDSGLTTDALKKHNAIHIFGHGLGDIKTKSAPTVSDISLAKSIEDISLAEEGGDDASESSIGTFKTFQTFASDWSACSNASFTRLLRGFDPKCALHKEMLAILAAVTEIIKEKGGSETSTEYYAALMETLRVTEGDEGIAATISLLSMGLKSVPTPVLRNQFSEASDILLDLLGKYSDSDHNVILRCIIGCLSVLLRAQEYITWSEPFTMKVFDSLLAFVIHSKPKLRKAAQHAVCSILRASCFMLPSEENNQKPRNIHPVANRVASTCISHMKAEVLQASQTTVLHTLTMLKEIIGCFSKEYIKSSCEAILSLMMHNDILIKTWCLRTLHSLFSISGEESHLTSPLVIQLIRALTVYKPSAADSRQTLAWVTVMQQAFICLAKLDLQTCMSSLPSFVHNCVGELWLSDKMDVISASSNAIKTVLQECVQPACETEEKSKRYWESLESIFKSIKSGLDNPFNQSTKHVILTIAVCFEVGNKNVESLLAPLLIHLNERRESHNFALIKEMEYATGCAVKHLGPDFVLKCIPLKKTVDSIDLERSWLLPVLKDRTQNSSLEFFAKDILNFASLCRNKCKAAAATGDKVNAHTYELLCGQFWALLPNFCNNPSDIKENFKTIARVLGTILKDNPDYRPSVMQGLRKLINSAGNSGNLEDAEEIGRFAKNFLPLLLNIYMTPVKGGSAEGQRLAALETLQVYLTVSPHPLRHELFESALSQLDGAKDEIFKKECLLDIIRVLVLYQSQTDISNLFEKWVFPLCENTAEDVKKSSRKEAKKINSMDTEEPKVRESKSSIKERAKMVDMEHKKAYRILEEIFKSDQENCKEFLTENKKKIQRMLMTSLHKAADGSKATRLKCIQYLIKSQPNLDHDSKLIKNALPEAVICTKDINSKCRQYAFDLINIIGETLQTKKDGLDYFTEMLEAGLQGNSTVVIASIWCLASATFNFSAALGISNLQRIMGNVCQLMSSANRQIVSACVAYIKVYTRSLPSPLIAGSLPLIFKSIAEMIDDCKRHCRSELGHLLSRLMRKYGAETLSSLIPESDEGMHRKLRYLRKMDSRKKRLREMAKNQKAEDDDSDADIQVKGSAMTMDEILKDSDSEIDVDDEEENTLANRDKKKNKQNRKNQTWITEDENNIIDLMDPASARNITATKPNANSENGISEIEKAKKKKKEVKTTPDGKLILDFDNDSDSDDDKKPSRIKEDSDDSDSDRDDNVSSAETMLMSAGKKRKFDDIRSNKSGMSGSSKFSQATSKYKTGGKGIHRKTSSGNSAVGSEYKAKKARGDMKKTGMPDPYAYIPLARTNLNKRKQLKKAGQFNNIMKGAQRGAATGRITKVKTKMRTKKHKK